MEKENIEHTIQEPNVCRLRNHNRAQASENWYGGSVFKSAS